MAALHFPHLVKLSSLIIKTTISRNAKQRLTVNTHLQLGEDRSHHMTWGNLHIREGQNPALYYMPYIGMKSYRLLSILSTETLEAR